MSGVTFQITGFESVLAGASGKQTGKIETAVGKGLMALAMMAGSEAKRSIVSGSKTGTLYGRGKTPKGRKRKPHQASAPGEAPANDLGNLASSIKSEAVDNSTVNLIADAPYALFLEYGTRNMEPRPFMAPAAEKVGAKGAETIAAFVKAALK